MIEFEYQTDREFFEKLLLAPGDSLALYADLFDFREPRTKRKEFNRLRGRVLLELISTNGQICQLKYHPDCTNSLPLQVDHLIPISSNKLNKEIRNIRADPGRKVAAQSFGSNHPLNLVLACARCNAHKKHRIPEPDLIRRVLNARLRQVGS